METKNYVRYIPKVDVWMATPAMQALLEEYEYALVLDVVREELDALRRELMQPCTQMQAQIRLQGLTNRIQESLKRRMSISIRPLINATGTILHTNFGRAPWNRKHFPYLLEVASGYCNLEYNLETGERGDRQEHLESLLCRLTGAEAALVVNNNAAAMLLAIHTLAKGGATVVSRGELIEVGGKFRLPDVIEESGARLREVGTTNRTYLEDYRNALNEETRLLLKVHTSNYQVLGFAQSVSIEELVALGKESNVPVLEDLGSGTLVDLQAYGVGAEPTVQSSVQQGVDVVCFSADKLLGGPQAGILVGKKKILEKMRINPLLRALRVDKFTTAALELHLRDYLQPERAMQEVPVLRMIVQPLDEVKLRANTLLDKMVKYPAVELSVGDSVAQIGGGAMPLEEIESAAVLLCPVTMSVNALEGKLRKMPVPVIGRIVNQQILLDLRTISPEMEDVFLEQWNTKMEF